MFFDIFLLFLTYELFVIGILCEDCPKVHLQKQYCISDFAFHGGVPKITDDVDIYKIRIIELYKGNAKMLKLSNNDTVDIRMKMDLANQIGREFLIFANYRDGLLRADWCTGIFHWFVIKQVEQQDLIKDYRCGCDCINEISDYSQKMYCEYKYGFIKRNTWKCMWHGYMSYGKCKNNIK